MLSREAPSLPSLIIGRQGREQVQIVHLFAALEWSFCVFRRYPDPETVQRTVQVNNSLCKASVTVAESCVSKMWRCLYQMSRTRRRVWQVVKRSIFGHFAIPSANSSTWCCFSECREKTRYREKALPPSRWVCYVNVCLLVAWVCGSRVHERGWKLTFSWFVLTLAAWYLSIIHHVLLCLCKAKCVSPWKQPSVSAGGCFSGHVDSDLVPRYQAVPICSTLSYVRWSGPASQSVAGFMTQLANWFGLLTDSTDVDIEVSNTIISLIRYLSLFF